MSDVLRTGRLCGGSLNEGTLRVDHTDHIKVYRLVDDRHYKLVDVYMAVKAESTLRGVDISKITSAGC